MKLNERPPTGVQSAERSPASNARGKRGRTPDGGQAGTLKRVRDGEGCLAGGMVGTTKYS